MKDIKPKTARIEYVMKAFFPSLTPEEGNVVQGYTSSHQAKVGTILVELGSDDRDLYLLKSGSCEVYQKFRLGEKLYALRVGNLEAPLVLGEANLLLGEKRNATIIIAQELEYYKLTLKDYELLKTQHPAIAIKVLEEIAKVSSRRFLGFQKLLMERFLAEEPRPSGGIQYLKKFVGQVYPCSAELAKKLFNMDQPPVDEMEPLIKKKRGEPPFDYDEGDEEDDTDTIG